MPIYAYRCERCGYQKDVLQKMSDPRLVDCPSCGEPTFRKQVTAAGFQLKGSGWYVTDFRDTGKKDAKTAKGDEPASGDAAAAPPESGADRNATKPDAASKPDTAPASGSTAAATPAPAASPPPAPKAPAGGTT